MNNDTTCKKPLQPVGEHSEVLRARIDGRIADDLEHQCSKRVVTTRQVSAALQRLQKSKLVHQPGIKGYWQLTL